MGLSDGSPLIGVKSESRQSKRKTKLTVKIKYNVPFSDVRARFALGSEGPLGKSDFVLKIGFEGYELDRDLARQLGLPYSSGLKSAYLYNPESVAKAVVKTRFFKLPAQCNAITLELIPWLNKDQPLAVKEPHLELLAPFDGYNKMVMKGEVVE